jgi:hypothetical protein
MPKKKEFETISEQILVLSSYEFMFLLTSAKNQAHLGNYNWADTKGCEFMILITIENNALEIASV